MPPGCPAQRGPPRRSARTSSCTSSRARCWWPPTSASPRSRRSPDSGCSTCASRARRTTLARRRWTSAAMRWRPRRGWCWPSKRRRDDGVVRVATVGRLVVSPGVRNVVPGAVELSIDVRDVDPVRLDEGLLTLREIIGRIAQDTSTSAEVELTSSTPPVHSTPALVDEIVTVAAELGVPAVRLPSGAGHDAQVLGRIVPMAMIFVPSVGGVSHSPAEHTEPADLVLGAEVLAHTVRRLLQAGHDAVRPPPSPPCHSPTNPPPLEVSDDCAHCASSPNAGRRSVPTRPRSSVPTRWPSGRDATGPRLGPSGAARPTGRAGRGPARRRPPRAAAGHGGHPRSRLAGPACPGGPERPAGGDHRAGRAQDDGRRAEQRRQGLPLRPRGRPLPDVGQPD